MSAKFKIENGFPNHSGEGSRLAGKLIEGTIKIGDCLIINETVKIPMLEIKQIPPGIILISIPREFDSESCGVKLFDLFGKTFEVEEA